MANPSATNLSVDSGATIGGVQIHVGSGVPTLSSAKGSLYINTAGTTTSNRAYVNTDGGTTWTNFTTAA